MENAAASITRRNAATGSGAAAFAFAMPTAVTPIVAKRWTDELRRYIDQDNWGHVLEASEGYERLLSAKLLRIPQPEMATLVIM